MGLRFSAAVNWNRYSSRPPPSHRTCPVSHPLASVPDSTPSPYLGFSDRASPRRAKWTRHHRRSRQN
eukprot:7078675-Prymnesium_polylepis.1